MKVTELKKEISKTNVKGYSKLKKEDIINLMLKYPKRFMYLVDKPEVKKPEVKKPEVKEPEVNTGKILNELSLLNNVSDDEKEYIRPDKVYKFISQWRQEEIKQYNKQGYHDDIVVKNVLEMFYKLIDDAGKYGIMEVEEDLNSFINDVLPDLPEKYHIRDNLEIKLSDLNEKLDKNKISEYKKLNNKTINKLIKEIEFKKKLIRKALTQIRKS